MRAAFWTLSNTTAYNFSVDFTDGTSTTLSRRERPQLVFDPATGAPTHLINGVRPSFADEPKGDYSYTMIVPLRVLSGPSIAPSGLGEPFTGTTTTGATPGLAALNDSP